MNKFGRPNYLTAPKNSVGVASHKVYYTHDQYDRRQPKGYDKGGFMNKRSASEVSGKKALT